MLHAGGSADTLNFGVQANPYRFNNNSLSHRTGTKQIGAERFGRIYGETHARSASTPDGYAAKGAWVLPVIAGGMSSAQASFGLTGSGSLLQGGPMEGTATLSFSSAPASMSLTVGLAGTTALTLAGNGGLALTIGLSGNGDFSVIGSGGLSMIVPIDGTANISLIGSGNLKGNLGMEGSWGGATPLSPEGLADAVWAKLNSNGTPYGTVVTNTEKQAKLAVALSA